MSPAVAAAHFPQTIFTVTSKGTVPFIFGSKRDLRKGIIEVCRSVLILPFPCIDDDASINERSFDWAASNAGTWLKTMGSMDIERSLGIFLLV